ncbi:hypothetical protein [Desulfitibacter alkalitolerans]|nr:hypothetical protein [Desulfitibacter alkalitolerans]
MATRKEKREQEKNTNYFFEFIKIARSEPESLAFQFLPKGVSPPSL